MNNRKRIIIAAAGLIILSLAGFFIYKKYFSTPDIQVLETGKVERGSIREILVETGIVKSQVGAVVKIGTRATGRIVQMNVRVGDRVTAGQLIALIDDREITRAIEQQKAARVSAESTLSQVELTYPERIREAEANFNYAGVTLDRERELLKQEYTTKDSVDKAEMQFQATDAILKRLRDEHVTEMKIAAGRLGEIEAQLKQQEIRLSYTRIYSPMDGVVSDVTAQEGETIVAGLQVANLVTVLNPRMLEMWIYIDETDIGRTAVGAPVEYYVDTYPEKTFTGVIEKINPQPVVKENIVYYLATLRIPESDASFLKPEMTTHVKIVTLEKKGILTAPNAAIKYEKGKQIAYTVTGKNDVEKRELKIGIRGEERTEILSGVGEGDVVATKIILPVATPQNNMH
ncbi:MAG: efflux RND transporter periplasmic adaptor subunit [Deltaproteobacteria bacterium]|nr:efflux RND transporter periplasmic adaptor subunit [Deltaproteobacteria bacterium]